MEAPVPRSPPSGTHSHPKISGSQLLQFSCLCLFVLVTTFLSLEKLPHNRTPLIFSIFLQFAPHFKAFQEEKDIQPQTSALRTGSSSSTLLMKDHTLLLVNGKPLTTYWSTFCISIHRFCFCRIVAPILPCEHRVINITFSLLRHPHFANQKHLTGLLNSAGHNHIQGQYWSQNSSCINASDCFFLKEKLNWGLVILFSIFPLFQCIKLRQFHHTWHAQRIQGRIASPSGC